MEDKVSKTKEIPTNDFDLQKKKQPKLSTIKTQKKNAKNIIERTIDLQKIKVNLMFDRLKICVDLHSHGKKIDFKLGENMKQSNYPYLPSYKQLLIAQKEATPVDIEAFLRKNNEYDEEIDYSKGWKENIYPNCCIDSLLLKNTIGINNIYIYNDRLIIDITGKLMAEYGYLGYLHIDNIKKALNKLKELGLFSFDTEKFLKNAGCFLCDCTLDILFPENKQVKRMINALGSYAPLISDKTKSAKFKKNGIIFKKNTSNDPGFSVDMYDKGEEIKNSVLKEDKPVKYTETIGFDGEEEAKRTLRAECHLYIVEAIRKFLGIDKKVKGFVSLMSVLKSKEPVLLNVLKELHIEMDGLYKSIEDYELNKDFFNKDKYLSAESFDEVIISEWLAYMLKQNDYNLLTLKKHILTEYNFDPNDKVFKERIKGIKKNLFDFLVYRKPKTVSSLILLFTLITDAYLGTLVPKKNLKKRVVSKKQKIQKNFLIKI